MTQEKLDEAKDKIKDKISKMKGIIREAWTETFRDKLISEIMPVPNAGNIVDTILFKVDKEISILLDEFANTPLDKRETGWNWLLKLRERILR